MTDGRTVYQVGNFGPEHSTENHLRTALEDVGCHVVPMQENDPRTWGWLMGKDNPPPVAPDLVLWTRTWHLPDMPQLSALQACKDAGVPTVGYHLDRWWGLNREHQVQDEPFFRCDLVITADGGHDKQWAEAGVNHAWLPPGVLAQECVPGRRRPVSCDFAFVGSWQHYHDEWPWRKELIQHMRDRYARRFQMWPKGGGASIRGRDLADLYASVPVLIGDSCLAPTADGEPIERYWSDRVPETLGRGGLLVHPRVEGLAEAYHHNGPIMFDRCDPDDLFRACDTALELALGGDGTEGREIRERSRQEVLDHHTYQRRCEQMLELVDAL